MVNFEAIYATSESLRNLLVDRMDLIPNTTGSVYINISRPEKVPVDGSQVNLFLYKIMLNSFLRNSNDNRVWLDLFYLVIPYGYEAYEEDGGEESEKDTQNIIGDVIRVFHDYPIIYPKMKFQTNVGDLDKIIGDSILEGDELPQAIEKIKITPTPITLEELSHIWSPINMDFRLSMAYQVSVVQIDSKIEKLYPAPVRSRNIDVIPFMNPTITQIRPMRVRSNEHITILGSNFDSMKTVVKISGNEYTPNSNNISDNKITMDVQTDLTDLIPGTHLVEVIYKPLTGKNYGFSSNQAVFLLVPMIIEINNVSGVVTITGTNLCDQGPPELKPVLLVGDQSIPMDTDNPDVVVISLDSIKQIETKLPNTLCPIRIKVNNVESLGIRVDEKNELMWFYDKTQTIDDNKIVKKKFPEEVYGS